MATRSSPIWIDLGQAGEVQAVASFEFQPRERMTRDDPGCSAGVEINSVMWNGIDWWPYFSPTYRDGIEQDLLENELEAA